MWFRCSLNKPTANGNKVLLILKREEAQNLGRPDKAIITNILQAKYRDKAARLDKKMEKLVCFRNQVGSEIAVIMGAVVVLASI